ncbi:MAG: polysaccharide biosynthesis C-terminal domain-containing protein [Hyphomicrobiales bacterium]|nr:polysaccharide biosynthesis C-terminal domain-containing protein [Hyphomicrobiales bacterium]
MSDRSVSSGLQRYAYPLAIGGGMASRLATLAILILLPSHIGLTEYGYFVLVITLGEIIEMTSSNWYRLLLVRQGVNDHAPAADITPATEQKSPPGRFTFRSLIAAMTLLALFGALMIAPYFGAHAANGRFTLAVAAYVFSFAFFKLLIAVLQAQKQQQLIGLLELFRGVTMSIFVALALLLDQTSFFYPVMALSAAAILAALAGAVRAWRGLPALLGQVLQPNSFTTIGLPIVIATILTFQLGWFDRLFIQSQLGPEMVGLYVAVAAVARQPIDLVLNALNTQTFPIMMERSELARRNAAGHATGILVSAAILGFGGAGAIIALTHPLAAAVLPAFDSADTAILVAPITIGSVFLGLKHFVFDNVFHAHGRNWLMLKWFGIISTASLLLAAVAILIYGVRGAAFAFLGGSLFALVSSAVISRRIWTFPIPVSALVRIVVSAAAAGIPVYYMQHYWQLNPWAALVAGGVLYGLVYLASLTILLRFKPSKLMAAPWELYLNTGAAR